MARKIRCCECGCRQAVKPGNRFIHGHHRKNIKHTKETIEKMSIAKTGMSFEDRWNKIKDIIKYCKCGCKQEIIIKSHHTWYGVPDYIHGHTQRGKFLGQRSDEIKQKISIGNKGNKNGMYGKIPWNKGKTKEEFPQLAWTEETKQKTSETMGKRLASGEIKLSCKWFDTSIELVIEKQLKLNNLNYEKQKYIKNVGIVDFFLSDYEIILECDGDFWHGNKRPLQQQKDADRDFKAMLYHNYETIRFWQYEINESPENCIKKIKKFIKRK